CLNTGCAPGCCAYNAFSQAKGCARSCSSVPSLNRSLEPGGTTSRARVHHVRSRTSRRSRQVGPPAWQAVLSASPTRRRERASLGQLYTALRGGCEARHSARAGPVGGRRCERSRPTVSLTGKAKRIGGSDGHGVEPTVDDELRSGDEPPRIAGQEQNRPRNVVELPEAAHQHV